MFLKLTLWGYGLQSPLKFRNFFVAWSGLWVQITDDGRSLYIESFCPAMKSLRRCLEEAAFSISISSSVFIFLWLFSRCIMDMVSSIVLISCPSLRTCLENLDLPSGYLRGKTVEKQAIKINLTEIFPSVYETWYLNVLRF